MEIPTNARPYVRKFLKSQSGWPRYAKVNGIVSREALNQELIDFAKRNHLLGAVDLIITCTRNSKPNTEAETALEMALDFESQLNALQKELEPFAEMRGYEEMRQAERQEAARAVFSA